ncbi:unnamed protein product [Ranitomeya imitator]|uniref:Leptin receptor gene-related protein n=1 Tax=Ranitomeya imitator TaxID=111125 RepID=A0ABN9KR09_9NEOB|nr:unnamed protein product [Ranitomeya imitator]
MFLTKVFGTSQSATNRQISENSKLWKEALLAASRQISGQHVQIYSDNMTTVAHIKHQAVQKILSLKKISARIFYWAAKNHLLSLTAIHLKGTANIQADYLSRQDIHPGEWSLDLQTFNMLVQKWGLPEVDLFASYQNAKVKNLLFLEPKRQSQRSGCPSPRLALPACLRISANPNPGKGSKEDTIRRDSDYLDSSFLAQEKLVQLGHPTTSGWTGNITSKEQSPLSGSYSPRRPSEMELSSVVTEAHVLKAKGTFHDGTNFPPDTYSWTSSGIQKGKETTSICRRGRFLETELTQNEQKPACEISHHAYQMRKRRIKRIPFWNLNSLFFFRTYWPLFVLIFYVISPIPHFIATRVSDDSDAASSACRELAYFFTTGIVVSAFGLPIVLARMHVIFWGACGLVLAGNAVIFLTILGFFIVFGRGDDFSWEQW